MARYVSVLALLAGLGVAVAIHSANRADPPQPRADLPALPDIASASRAADAMWMPTSPWLAGWPAQPLPGLPSDVPPAWPADVAASGLHVGNHQPHPLAALQAAPLNLAANPLLLAGQDAGLGDNLRLELAPAPEPQSWAMFIAGMLLVGGRLRRRQQTRSGYLATL